MLTSWRNHQWRAKFSPSLRGEGAGRRMRGKANLTTVYPTTTTATTIAATPTVTIARRAAVAARLRRGRGHCSGIGSWCSRCRLIRLVKRATSITCIVVLPLMRARRSPRADRGGDRREMTVLLDKQSMAEAGFRQAIGDFLFAGRKFERGVELSWRQRLPGSDPVTRRRACGIFAWCISSRWFSIACRDDEKRMLNRDSLNYDDELRNSGHYLHSNALDVDRQRGHGAGAQRAGYRAATARSPRPRSISAASS